MGHPRRYETLQLGSLMIQGHEFSVRLLRADSTPPQYYVMVGGVLGDAYASVAGARAYAKRNLPGLSWRTDLSLHADEAPCVICSVPTERHERYPRALCPSCVLEAVDEHGQPLRFVNIDFGGGFRALREDGTEVQNGHLCLVRGVRCWADEAYFGGIVLQPR